MTDEQTEPADQHTSDDQAGRGSSRRVFLGGIGLGVVGAAGGALAWRQRASAPGIGPAVGAGGDHQGHGAPGGPPEGAYPHAQRDALQFFNPHQAMTIEAVAARIIPGDEDDPGAREAGVIYYIDHMLATHAGYPEPAYMQGPFAQTYSDDEPPEDDDGENVWVHEDELERYGRQSMFVPREVYRMAVARLDAVAQDRHDDQFIDLSESDQDGILEDVEDEDDDVADTFGDLSPGYFFDLVRTHTLQGFLSDPVYGGNRDMVGWRLVGFPGSRRSYSPQDMFNENFDVTPQSLLDLPPFNADYHHDHGEGVPALRQRHPKGPID